MGIARPLALFTPISHVCRPPSNAPGSIHEHTRAQVFLSGIPCGNSRNLRKKRSFAFPKSSITLNSSLPVYHGFLNDVALSFQKLKFWNSLN
jgi:hypothetical protein